jgi:alpha-L-fucosidase 2
MIATLLAGGLLWGTSESADVVHLSAPVSTWDEGIPLGNGLLGGLLWGGDSTLNVSLDRGDLWDERSAKGMQWEKFKYRSLVEMVNKKDRAGIDDIFERAYYDVHPTKLPGGRLVLDLGSRKISSFDLDLNLAESRVQLGALQSIQVIWSGDEKAGIFEIPGRDPIGVKLLTPGMVAKLNGASDGGPDSYGVGKLGYPEAKFGSEPGLEWYEQTAALGLRYVVAAGWQQVGDGQRLVVTVTSTADGKEPIEIAKARIKKTLGKNKDRISGAHRKWWSEFNGRSNVSLPDQELGQHYRFVRYLYGSGSRRGAPPLPLQGVWTADAGNLPPWKGDYHNDLNTQMTYMGYQAAGQFDVGLSYLDFLWERKGRFERFAREFYETDGLAVPGVMTLAGEPLAGWVQYSLSPTMTSWSAHLFYLHWRYTGDDKFLRTRAYPWCREAGVSVEQLLVERDGRLVLPLSSSPEIFDNSDRAWMKPNSNYDLMSLRMQFLSLAEMAQAVGDRKDSEHWKSLSDRLGEYHVREDGTLKLNEIEDLPGSHRHLSNLMGIHPFNLITVDGGYGDVRMINRSLEEWEAKGTQGWTGYSFSWMAAVMARVGRGDDAYQYLDIYRRAFLLRNGFHANGDQTDQGYSSMHYRPFTLEGNFLAMNAIHEMLLQSWSPSPGVLGSEVIRVFPAIPKTWDTVSFRDLRSEGGYTVSASRTEGRQVIEIKVSQDGVLRVQNNYSGEWKWNREDVRLKGRVWEVQVKSGDVVQAGISRGDG